MLYDVLQLGQTVVPLFGDIENNLKFKKLANTSQGSCQNEIKTVKLRNYLNTFGIVCGKRNNL